MVWHNEQVKQSIQNLVLNLKCGKRWIKPAQISKAVSSIKELSSVLILTRRDNVEQSWLVEYDQ